MAIVPSNVTLNTDSAAILNTIRAELGGSYQNDIPIATASTESIHAIGDIVMGNTSHQNALLNSLINRIGMVITKSKMYSNPWSMFKRGIMEMGETMEEIFVNIAHPYQYDPSGAENDVFKRKIPDVRAAFHPLNYQKFYKTTVSQEQLRQAFLSINGVTDLIASIVESMYTGANYDEYIVMKYMLCRSALNGYMMPVVIPEVTKANAGDIVSLFKSTSNDFEFLDTQFNITGVYTSAKKDEQYLIVTNAFDSVMDVNVLATAFNMDKVTFLGHKVNANGKDGFASHDTARLAELFAGDPAYTPFTADELAVLKTMPAILCARGFWMIYDNFIGSNQMYNGEGLYWNQWLHTWKTFSVSPFENAALFTSATSAVTSVSVSPATAGITKGQDILALANVQGTGFLDRNVVWTMEGKDAGAATVALASGTSLYGGKLHVAADETAVTIVVTATSVADGTKKATCTVTVA